MGVFTPIEIWDFLCGGGCCHTATIPVVNRCHQVICQIGDCVVLIMRMFM